MVVLGERLIMDVDACPFCGAKDLQNGEMWRDPHFIPKGIKAKRFVLTMKMLWVKISGEAVMCLGCGKVWSSADPVELKDLIARHTRK